MRGADWHFEWYRDWGSVWRAPCLDVWNETRIASASAHVYHDPRLVRAWAETVGNASTVTPCVGVGRSLQGQTVVLPWIIATSAGRMCERRTLESMGRDLFGYHDPLTAALPGEIDWSGLWRDARTSLGDVCDQALFRSVDAVFLPHIDELEPAEDSPVLDVTPFSSLDAVLANCSSNHRGDVRRRRRRLDECGRVELWVAEAGDADRAVRSWRDEAAPAYRDVWSRRSQKNTLVRPGLDDLIDRILTDGIREGWAHYAALEIDGRAIAWHVGLVDRDRLFWWIPAHRVEWESHSPGKVLLSMLVEHGIANRWRELHLLTGDHAYKRAWRPRPTDRRVVRWHAPGVRGHVLSWYDAMRQTA